VRPDGIGLKHHADTSLVERDMNLLDTIEENITTQTDPALIRLLEAG
jgi:hypothetical protein